MSDCINNFDPDIEANKISNLAKSALESQTHDHKADRLLIEELRTLSPAELLKTYEVLKSKNGDFDSADTKSNTLPRVSLIFTDPSGHHSFKPGGVLDGITLRSQNEGTDTRRALRSIQENHLNGVNYKDAKPDSEGFRGSAQHPVKIESFDFNMLGER